ncbi:hypothetical protein CJ030_MR1G022062 [Morella rubra]|uniref:RNase H type-1 domain-containing protein n=1 Tax=Morella rubra TaxID=262757 RepID=A0A6A1WRB5_9ROSI|nr:hypothetical protein CJ030_MR1G022062 [Morella rubra]
MLPETLLSLRSGINFNSTNYLNRDLATKTIVVKNRCRFGQNQHRYATAKADVYILTPAPAGSSNQPCAFKIAVSPLIGEAEAAKVEAELALAAGCINIVLEGDSKVIIKAIQTAPQKVDWRIDSLVSYIVSVLHLIKSWKVRHVRRSANMGVHNLALWAATEIISGGNPCSCEQFPKLDWLYAGVDPP